MTLLGDACHPTLPMLAQGAVMPIEDGFVLARCFERWSADVATALDRYGHLWPSPDDQEALAEMQARLVAG